MKKVALFAILVVAVIALAGCGEKTKEAVQPTPTIEQLTPTAEKTSTQEIDIDKLTEIIEKKISPSPGSYPVDIINMVYNNGKLYIEYESAGPHESTVYKYMVQVMKILYKYIKDKNVNISEVTFKAIEWHYGDVYTLTLTIKEMQKFVTGEWGFSEWKEKVKIKKGGG